MEIGTLLDKDETAVFKACYDNSLEKESNIIDVREATRTIVESGLSTEQVQDCLEIILKRHLCNEYVGKSGSGRISTIQTNTYGFILYANAFIPKIDRLHADVLDAVVHRGLKSHKEVGAHLGISKFLVSYIFDILKGQGCIQTVKAMGDVHEVLLTTAEGRKAAGKPATFVSLQ